MTAINKSSKWDGRLLPVNAGGFSHHILKDTFTKPCYVFFRATIRYLSLGCSYMCSENTFMDVSIT